MSDEMFGPYRIEALIGRGGMGEVHRAFDTGRDRVVALKRLPAGLAQDVEFRARFRKEAALAARLHEPHIIPIHDFGEIDGVLFIDMRLVEGSDLAALLAAQGAFVPKRVVNVVAQVAAALDVAHGQGLVHRDIKPGNVLVIPASAGDAGASEFVYVADFGIARSVTQASTSLTATGATIGSLDYMAPERFDGGGDHRADVYSLGCVLFEALTARKPFVADGLPAMINSHLNLPAPRPSGLVPGLPAAFDAVVERAMAKNPLDRFATAGELAGAARAAAEGQAMPAATTGGPFVAAPPGQAETLVRAPADGSQWLGPAGAHEPTRRAAPFVAPTHTGYPTPARRRRRGAVLVAAAVGVLAVVMTAVVSLGLAGGSSDNLGNDPSQVKAEPVRAAGDNPFMPPVGSDRSGVVGPRGTGGTFSGATTGLYGGTLKNAECDPDRMVQFLEADPAKAAAWAEVQGIAPSGIRSYVAELTPVTLRSDTAVTNHGFVSGKATVVPSVLQAGTAVLVDRLGIPRSRCYCGNPLAPASLRSAPTYAGPTWSGFSASAITTIEPASTTIGEFTLVDLATQATFVRPAGSRGSQDHMAGGSTSVALHTIPSTTDAIGPSGSRADPGATGVPGGDNTSFWAGCEGVPANTVFKLAGDYSSVSGKLVLATFTPADLVIDIRLIGDGAVLDSASLRAGQTYSFAVATPGVRNLTLSAQAVSGACTTAPTGYGVVVDAVAVS